MHIVFCFFISRDMPLPQRKRNQPFSMYVFPVYLLVFLPPGEIPRHGENYHTHQPPLTQILFPFPYVILWLGSSKKDASYYLKNSTDCQLYVPCRNKSVWVWWDEVETGNRTRIALLCYSCRSCNYQKFCRHHPCGSMCYRLVGPNVE